jgi:hypothetical protein
MKKIITTVALVVTLIAFSNLVKAQSMDNKSDSAQKPDSAKQKTDLSNKKELLTSDYNRNNLLSILAGIQNDLENKDLKTAQSKSSSVSAYLKDRRNNKGKISKQDNKVEKLLELEYGTLTDSKAVIVPLGTHDKVLKPLSIKEKIDIYHFSANQINNAKIRYVTYYDKDDEGVNKDLDNFLSAVTAGDEAKIRKELKNIYKDIFKDSDDKITTIAKIRDNLTLARYLASNGQPKAAEENVKWTDSLILKLIELTSNNPTEQQAVKKLKEELKDVSKLSDEKYLSEWEKLDIRMQEWWKKNIKK